MAKSHNQKAKILFLVKMLLDTGEDRVVTMQDILGQLGEYGISAERKSIYDDFEALRDFGLDVKFRRGRPGGYYLADSGPLAGWKKRIDREKPEQDAPEEESAQGEPAEQKASEEAPAEHSPVLAEGSPESPEASGEEQEESSETDAAPAPEKAGDDRKQMRLLCSLRREKEIREYFGDEAEYKEKGYGNFTVAAPLRNTPAFYGWLASMERDVYIVKPRKAALAYREYLKKIAREYKGI